MDTKHYRGRSNVSGATALDDHHFIVADDEDNQLSIFDKNQPKALKPSITLSKVFDGQIKDGKQEELDLEGSARINDIYFWIGSHSTSSKGKNRTARHRLFGIYITETKPGKFKAKRCGGIYNRLITDLKRDIRFIPYGFDRTESIAPKAIGGLSIEGLADTPEQGLLIGFRNPLAGGEITDDKLIAGKALLINLLNPLAVLQGQAAKFAKPFELNLDGLGIRDIARLKDHKYLIVAGPYHTNEDRMEKHRLYFWDSESGKLDRLDHIDLKYWNIEAAFFFPNQVERVELLTDDGEQKGFQCISVTL
jgi:hypothetical protein